MIQVSNVDQVISLVRQKCGQTRVFALGRFLFLIEPRFHISIVILFIINVTGLGSSASHHLVEGLARAGNGTALFASLEERLETKVMQQLQDALQPSLTGNQKLFLKPVFTSYCV